MRLAQGIDERSAGSRRGAHLGCRARVAAARRRASLDRAVKPELRIHLAQRGIERNALRIGGTPQLEHLLRGHRTPGLDGGIEQDLIEQIALRMASADLRQCAAWRGSDAARRQSYSPCAYGIHPLAGGQRDFPPHLARMRRSGSRERPHRIEQGVRLRAARARQSVEILHREERQHRVPGARGQMIAQILPACAHIDSRDLHPREQRHRTDLILGVILGDAPAAPIVDLEHVGESGPGSA